MQKLLFRNRWIAAAWVLGLMVSIVAFFGDGGGQQKLEETANGIRAQKQELEKPHEGTPIVIDEEEPDEDLSADEQVDTTGNSGADEANDGDVYVVIDNSTKVPSASDEELASKEIQ